MKRTITLLLALTMILALFAGCNNDSTTTATDTPATKAPSSTVDPETQGDGDASGADVPPESNRKYNYAVDDVGMPLYEAADNGIAVEPYAYPLPLTTENDTFTFFTIQWMQSMYPENADGQYGNTPYPVETKRQTGVNIEYTALDMDSYGTQFPIMLASDDISDLSVFATYYYTEKAFREAILSEGYWINLYDYRQYAPNYFYQATRDPNDKVTLAAVFPERELTFGFQVMWDVPTRGFGFFIRGDWMEEYVAETGKLSGMNADLKTLTDWEDILTWCLTAGKSANPFMIYQTLEIATMFNMYDTYAMLNQGVYVVNGQVQWAQSTPNDLKVAELFNKWLKAGIIDPEWESYANNESVNHIKFSEEYLFIQATSNGAAEHDFEIEEQSPNANYGWLPVTKPTVTRDQTIHLGDPASRCGAMPSVISQKTKNKELLITWCDWKYSDDGALLNTFGAEHVSFEYNANGEPQLTDLVAKNPQMSLTMLALLYMQNTFTDPGMKLAYGQWQFEGTKVPDAFDMWNTTKYDNAYTWPSAVVFSTEQLNSNNTVAGDVRTFISENFVQFVSGQKPFSEYEAYAAELRSIGVDTLVSNYQAAYDSYMALNG